ncbi:MAG: type II toxin-antitoxin system prevent-host-death family antitoxin [Acidobacteria bacterium]|nr:type II toxin-antitoxin system prevent-host-death family antitoxin [Acidobacteriota bacterium]MCH8986018.1 type II toxin-antitoxin system prevent-host-death family antitoxin [Acidobacteriota bacterium]
MSTVDIREAKNNLSRLLRRVPAGEEITITRSGESVAKPCRSRSSDGSAPMRCRG